LRYRQLSPTGDFQFGAAQADFLIDSPAAVAQAVQTSLRLWLGEWYLNVNDGTPYPESIIGYHSKDDADTAIQAVILGVAVIISSTNVPNGFSPGQSVAGVNGIVNFQSEIDPASRAYSASCVLNTIYGPTPYEISNYPNF
jgi:hypothetical protein